ncbi:hypothetical protein [Rhizobium sp. IMFF44]|uniref:hypothetical protein n=1 Tax=Rhizobium sp. IMFF44 TaxID=3342350 RepID=UPI0035B7B60D
MKNPDPNFLAALQGARDNGLSIRSLVYFSVKKLDGTPVELGVWTGDEDMAISVMSGVTGQMVYREYYGGGLVEDIDPIPRVSDLTIQTVTITLSQIASVTQQLARGYDIRLGKVEIHRAILDRKSRRPVSAPELDFMGEIDGSPIDTPQIGEDGGIQINAVSDAISMLTRKNPLKSSYEAQKRRSGDEFGKYASTVSTWDIPWGQKKKKNS